MTGLDDLRGLAQEAWDHPGRTVRGSVALRVEDWEALMLEAQPELCQQFGCNDEAATWCPLCRAYLCAEHDALTPTRRHDCLRGKAEIE